MDQQKIGIITKIITIQIILGLFVNYVQVRIMHVTVINLKMLVTITHQADSATQMHTSYASNASLRVTEQLNAHRHPTTTTTTTRI